MPDEGTTCIPPEAGMLALTDIFTMPSTAWQADDAGEKRSFAYARHSPCYYNTFFYHNQAEGQKNFRQRNDFFVTKTKIREDSGDG